MNVEMNSNTESTLKLNTSLNGVLSRIFQTAFQRHNFSVLFALILYLFYFAPANAQTTVTVSKIRLWGTPDDTSCTANIEFDRPSQEALCDEIFTCLVNSYGPDSSWPCSSADEGPCNVRSQNPQERGDLCLTTNSDGIGSGGYFARSFSRNVCPEGTVAQGSVCAKILHPAKELGCGEGQSLTSHPCNVATGNKLRREIDITGQGFGFTRVYNSLDLVDVGIGVGWRIPYQRSLSVYIDALEVVGSSGRRELWRKIDDVWTGDSDSGLILTETTSTFVIKSSMGSKDVFNKEGVLLSEVDTNGSTSTYSYYPDGNLQSVTNTYGQSLSFTYLDDRINSVEDQSGAIYLYQYDATGNLSSVVYPDTTPNDDEDNPVKSYHYDDVNNQNLLTGITDENGDRYANFVYNSSGQAVQSELGTTTNTAGQEKITLDYQAEAAQ